MTWWLVWLDDEVGVQTMDTMDPDCAIVVDGPNEEYATELAKQSAAAMDNWIDSTHTHVAENYEILRVAEALVGEKL